MPIEQKAEFVAWLPIPLEKTATINNQSGNLITGMLLIEVFIHSYSQDIDIGFYREASQHHVCAPDLARWATDAAFSRFKGRIIPDEDMKALVQALQIARKTNEKLKAYDVSRAEDKIRALKRGIRKTPALIINGKKYESLEEITEAISQLNSSGTGPNQT